MSAGSTSVTKPSGFGGTDLGRHLLRKFVEGELEFTGHTRIGNGIWMRFS